MLNTCFFIAVSYICRTMRLKSIHTKLLAFLTATFFLLAGTGITIVDFCCDSCESAGVEFIATHSCYDVHHMQEAESQNCCVINPENHSATTHCSMEKSCDVQRLELDVYSPSTLKQIASAPEDMVLFLNNVSCMVSQQTPSISESQQLFPPPEPFVFSGRTILTHKSVLLI